MPGTRTSIARKPVDVVLVAARCSERASLILAQAYERRGPVWSDLVLLDRAGLLERLRNGKRVFTARPRDLSGDFDVIARVRLIESDGTPCLRADGRASSGDDLGLPVF